VIAGLIVVEKLEILDNWPFALAVTGVIVVASAIADREHLLGEEQEPLEWVGIDRAFTEEDVRRLDAELGVPEPGS
jgi:hypothetical protein